MIDFIDKIDNYLKESADIDDAFIKKIAKLTDRNDHSKARIEIAKKVGNQQLLKIYNGIANLALAYGHMPMELITLRNFADDELDKYIKQKYGEFIFRQISGAL